MKDILIKNGLIVDGSGQKPYQGHVLIHEGLIADIATQEMPQDTANVVINAVGKVISPGFIDSHRHCDIAAMTNPDFGKIELTQGITTVLSGLCGLTPFPAEQKSVQTLYDFIEPCLGRFPDSVIFPDFQTYWSALDKTDQYINVGAMIGLGSVTTTVKGMADQPFSVNQMDLAQKHIENAMANGAMGVSSGVMYVPECYISPAEYSILLRPAAKAGKILTCHLRAEGDGLLPAIDEMIAIAEKAEIALNISHFKATGIMNWHQKIDQAIGKIENARARGMQVTVDFYPYTGGATTLLSLIPPLLQNNLTQFSTPSGIRRLKDQIYRQHPGWDNMVLQIGWERIIISSVNLAENRFCISRNIAEICLAEGIAEPVELIGRLLASEQGKVGIIVMSMCEEDVETIARLPYAALISDALYGLSDAPHPRLYGSFPRFIKEFVHNKQLVTLQFAVRKMTGMPADRYKISSRGYIKKGYAADLNVFSDHEITDHATFADPRQLASGIDCSLVNGHIVSQHNMMNNVRPGVILKG